MEKIINFSFSTNVSVEAYKSKDEARKSLYRTGAKEIGMGKMAFFERSITVTEFLNLATSGHTFCALFDYDPQQQYWIENKQGAYYSHNPVYKRGVNAGAMNICMKADRFFKGSQVIFVDVDYTRYSDVRDYIAALTYKPTCIYMSYSDKQDKGGIISRRFRLVYVFDSLLNKDEFIRVSNAIHRQIEQDSGEEMDDDCGTRPSQYMNGVYGNPETYQSDFIYSIGDFPPLAQPMEPVFPIQPLQPQPSPKPVVNFGERILYEIRTYNPEAFMSYNSWRGYVYRTERPDWYESSIGRYYQYQFTDDNYLQIWFCKEKVTDGHHRRSKLYKNACLRRLMYPDMTPDTALYNLFVDYIHFFDNSDGVITPDTLIDKVKKAFELSIEDLVDYCQDDIIFWQQNKPKFIIKNTGSDNRGIVKQVEKSITYAYLDSVYDPSISITQNIQNIDEYKKSTIYVYAKDRGFDFNPGKQPSERALRAERKKDKEYRIGRFKQLYSPNRSLRENQELLKEGGVELSKDTIKKWAELYIDKNAPDNSFQNYFDEIPDWSGTKKAANWNFSNMIPDMTWWYPTKGEA